MSDHERDDSNLLAGFDLAACEPPPLPDDFADRVLAELCGVALPVRSGANTAGALESAVAHRRWRRWWVAGGAAAVVAAGVGLVVWGSERPLASGHGEVIAHRAQTLDLGPTQAMVDPKTELTWRRDHHRIEGRLRTGVVQWAVDRDDTLVIDAGAANASVEASNARMRMEVRMLTRFDKQTAKLAGATAAAAALLTVTVFEGTVQVRQGDGNVVTVAAGTTYENVAHAEELARRADDLERELRELEDVPVLDQATCAIPLPPDAQVVVAGGEGRVLDRVIDRSGHEAQQVDVIVTTPGRVALIVAAYEPTVWNVHWASGSEVIGVIATGYHRQAVAGLPAATPIITSTYDGAKPCGYVTEHTSPLIDKLARQGFGAAVTARYTVATTNTSVAGVVMVGEPLAIDGKLASSSDHPVASFFDMSAPRSGKAGLADAVAQHKLRPATQDEIARVRRIAADEEIIGGPVYVVIDRFEFPAGLWGGDLATFIVPKGVPAPTGNRGHSNVFDLNP